MKGLVKSALTFSNFWKYSLRKATGFSGRTTHSWTIQSFKTRWILCIWTYASHSLKLSDSLILCSSMSRLAAILRNKLRLNLSFPWLAMAMPLLNFIKLRMNNTTTEATVFWLKSIVMNRQNGHPLGIGSLLRKNITRTQQVKDVVVCEYLKRTRT